MAVGAALASITAAKIGKEAIGTGVQLVSGLLQKGKAKKLRKEAERAAPPLEDPEERLKLTQLEREAKALKTGTAFSREKQELGSLLKQQNRAAFRLSGGAGGAAIAGSARNFQNIANVLVKLGTTSRRLGQGAEGLVLQLLNRISQRKLELRQLKSTRLLAEAAQAKKTGSSNVNAALASIISGIGGKKPTTGTDAGATSQVPDLTNILNPPAQNIPVTTPPEEELGVPVIGGTNLTGFFG